jgi:hypothetical protein
MTAYLSVQTVLQYFVVIDVVVILYLSAINVMILLAAFSDVTVKHFINHDLLRDLVSHTRDSLLAWPSSALEQNTVKS